MSRAPLPPPVVADAQAASPPSSALERAVQSSAARLADYLELTKPRIVILELIVAAAAACVAAPHAVNVPVLLWALAGVALVAGSACTVNQWMERRVDARMRRTANRPLAAGRVTSGEALALASGALVLGSVVLAWQVNVTTCALGLLSWFVYIVVYTPLKSRSPLNTVVGAISGAIPILMGWTASGTPLDLTAFSLAGVLFLWQFPHFMAIAWLHRRDYAAAGYQMLPVVDPSGIRAGVQAISGASLLIPVSLIPALDPTSGSPMVYALWAALLGGVQLALAIRFALERDERSARLLLRASLIYLPAWMGLQLMVSL